MPPLVYSPFSEVYNRSSSEIEWLVEGLIPRGTTFCLNGRGGIWKSWTMTAMGISVAASKPFLGKFKCPQGTTAGNSVLFIQLEETRDEAAHKAQWIVRGMGLKPQQIQDLMMGYVVDQPFRIDDAKRLDQLKILIDRATPELVMWDNARKMKLGNANDSEWADQIAFRLKELQSVYPSTHGLIHHWRKKSAERAMNDPDEMASGNAALRDAMAIWLPVEADEESNVVTMHHKKMRRGQKGGSFNYGVRIVDSEKWAALEYIGAATSTTSLAPDEDSVAGEILATLQTAPTRVWRQTDLISAMHGRYTERQVKYGLKELDRRHLITLQPSKGRQPTLVQLRSELVSEQQELPEPDTTVHQPDKKTVSGSSVLPRSDL
jgi:hypothetical protein